MPNYNHWLLLHWAQNELEITELLSFWSWCCCPHNNRPTPLGKKQQQAFYHLSMDNLKEHHKWTSHFIQCQFCYAPKQSLTNSNAHQMIRVFPSTKTMFFFSEALCGRENQMRNMGVSGLISHATDEQSYTIEIKPRGTSALSNGSQSSARNLC